MSLEKRILDDLKKAMLEKDAVSRDTLRMIKADLMNKSVELGRDLEEADVLAVLARGVKTRNDSIGEYEKGGRADAADAERAEIAVIERYLPKPLSEADLRAEIESLVAAEGLSGKKDLGKVMKAIKAKHGPAVDGKLASRLAGEVLG
jgi:uncharacterized protein YqeY